jgi:hypothetical protein
MSAGTASGVFFDKICKKDCYRPTLCGRTFFGQLLNRGRGPDCYGRVFGQLGHSEFSLHGGPQRMVNVSTASY